MGGDPARHWRHASPWSSLRPLAAAAETTTRPPQGSVAQGGTTAQQGPSKGGGSEGEGTREKSGGASGGDGGAEFRQSGGDDSVPDFGEEGTASERDQAAAVLRGYLKAQADEDWGAACARLSRMIQRQLEQLAVASKQAKDCAGILAGLSAALPPRSRASFARAEKVASLRVEGNRAFALYHGSGGVDYYMPMAKDGAEWKVASIAGTALP